MKKSLAKRLFPALLTFVMIFSLLPVSAFAEWNNTTYSGTTFGTNDYYRVISKKDYTLVPDAATETEMVINNADGTRRQVMHILEVDPSNPDVSIVPGYYNIDKLAADPSDSSAYKAAGVTDVAAYYEEALGYQVIGAMNTDLDYTDNAPRVLVYNGQILSGYAGAGAPKSVLYVWNNDGEISCEVTDYSKSAMEAGVESGNLLHAISVSFGMVVRDGALVTSKEERTSAAAARSMVGVKEDGTLVLVMNDGRGSNNSVGFCDYEEGECMLALGCKWAANCDGGGSSSFVTRRAGEENLVCRCVPCDGAERPTKSSVIVVSNTAPTGELGAVNINADYDIFAPNTTYTFETTALDTHGYAMDIPAEATWALSDESFGTIENGTFVSNGKTGNVNVQIKLNGAVVGTKEIQIANPTTLKFTADSTNLPYGKSTTLDFVSLIGEAEVYLDNNSFDFAIDNAGGTLNGLTFTAGTDESIAKTVITATYKATNTELTYTVNYGKGSEIVWDFEDGDLHGFLGQDDAFAWQIENGTNAYTDSAIYKGGNMSTCLTEKTFIATKENGGQVHNGEKSVGLTIDMTQVDFNTWVYANIYNVEGVKVLRDTANGNNATTFGMWVYIPYGFYTAENSGAMAIRFDFMAGKDAASAVRTNFNGAYHGKNVNSLTEADIPANRWIYVTTSLTGYNYVRTQDPTNGSDGYSPDLARMYVKPSVSQTLTYYFDNFTIDYSSAVDDRDAPVISNIEYALSDTNIAFNDNTAINAGGAAFNCTVADVQASNMTGLDNSTAAIYVDGKKITSTKVSGNRMYCDTVALGGGAHKVVFEIADKQGNYSTAVRTIVNNVTKDVDNYMYYRTQIKLSGHNDSGEVPMPGSVYYIDVSNQYSEGLDATFTLKLNACNSWILDNIITADGYDVTYTVNEVNPNEVTFNVSSTKGNGGEKVMFSVPVRVYNPLLTNGTSDGSAVTVSGKSFIASLCVEMIDCSVYGSYGNYYKYSVAELDGVRKIVRHEHTAHAVADKTATCTTTGYTGRTYCESCQSVVDWGTVTPAQGHVYVLADGVLACSGCGEKFNGVYTDGKTYIDGVAVGDGWDESHTHYYQNGVATVGQLLIDGVMCTFDPSGVYQPDALYEGFYNDGNGWMYFQDNSKVTGWVGIIDENNVPQWYFFLQNGYAATGTVKINGLDYKFDGEQGKCIGAWSKTADGTRFYFCKTYYKNVWADIEGATYYFDNNGYRYEGNCAVSLKGQYLGAWAFDENGQFIENINGVFTDNRTGTMYYAVDGEIQSGLGLVEIDGDYYYVRSNGAIVSNGNWYVDRNNSCGLPGGNYQFGADGKMVLLNGIVNDNGVLRYYINGAPQSGLGLIEIDGDYYYVRSNGAIVSNGSWYVDRNNSCGLPGGNYQFGADGKMVLLNGIVNDNGVLRYYINGAPQSGLGLIEIDGDYYYVRSNGTIVSNSSWYVDRNNSCGLPGGNYQFGADGEMVLLNGIVNDNGVLRYYINGVPQSGLGLIEIDGDYYYVRSNGAIVSNGSWYVDKNNQFKLPSGNYQFGTDGKMIVD